MLSFFRSKRAKFIEDNASQLARSLAEQCAFGAKEITSILDAQVPLNLQTDTIFLFLFSFRAAIESSAVKKHFGERPSNIVIREFDRIYRETFVEAYQETGVFSATLMKHTLTLIKSAPSDPLRTCATHLLGTRDPDHELFHISLMAYAQGTSILQIVEEKIGGST